jgi:hypothetical protein
MTFGLTARKAGDHGPPLVGRAEELASLEEDRQPSECGVVFASFKVHRHPSPLRHRATVASCRSGGHAIWWTVEAESEEAALAQLLAYVAERSTVERVSEVEIPRPTSSTNPAPARCSERSFRWPRCRKPRQSS